MTKEDLKSSQFFRLYTNVQGRLYSYLLMIVHNRDAADDLLQETAALMWEKFDDFQIETNFGAWGIAIARNMALTYLRKNKKSKMLFTESFYQDISNVARDSSADITLRIEALDNCLEKLPAKDQELLRSRFKENVSIKDLSQLKGRSVSSIYKDIASVMGLLRICIKRTISCNNV